MLSDETLGPYLTNGPIYRYEWWPNGNRKAVKEPNLNRTEYQYAWGVVSKITPPSTPASPRAFTEFGVNADGTIAWEETDGKRTDFVYDAAFRVTTIKPSGGRTWTEYGYDNINARSVIQSRLPASATTSLDGFGRAISTSDHTNVKTRQSLDACGRVVFQSHPYTAGEGNNGVSTTYDAMNRPLTVTAGAAVSQYLLSRRCHGRHRSGGSRHTVRLQRLR